MTALRHPIQIFTVNPDGVLSWHTPELHEVVVFTGWVERIADETNQCFVMRIEGVAIDAIGCMNVVHNIATNTKDLQYEAAEALRSIIPLMDQTYYACPPEIASRAIFTDTPSVAHAKAALAQMANSPD